MLRAGTVFGHRRCPNSTPPAARRKRRGEEAGAHGPSGRHPGPPLQRRCRVHRRRGGRLIGAPISVQLLAKLPSALITPPMSIFAEIFAERFLFWPPFWCNLVEGQRSRRSPSFRADSAALLPGSALSADCRARSDENSGDSPRRPRRRKATSALSADLRFRRTVSGAGERRKLDPTKSGCRRQPCAPASSPRRCT